MGSRRLAGAGWIRCVFRTRGGVPVAALLVTLLFLMPSCAGTAAPVRPPSLPRGDYAYAVGYGTWLIREEMRRAKAQGVSVSLVDDQKVVWAEGFGWANTAAKVPADADTLYRVGSVSKLFTVTAALQLLDQGQLHLDHPLTEYVPNFSVRSRFAGAPPITLRALMTHHSGLPGDHLKGMWSDHPAPLAALPQLLHDDYAAFPPGEVFSYSNIGMSLVGVAVQEVTHEDFAAYVRRTSLIPMGLTHSSFALQGIPQEALSYTRDEERHEPELREVPAGGLRSSARDLSQFLRMMLAEGTIDGHRILRPETVREMMRAQNADVPLDLGFHTGLGWMRSGLGGIQLAGAKVVLHHGGATLFQRAQLILLPEEKLGIAVLSNTAQAQGIVSKVATEVLALALEAKTGVRSTPPAPPMPESSLLSAEVDAYVGDYTTQAGYAYVERNGDDLSAHALGRTFRLVPRADKSVALRYRFLGIFPIDLGDLGTIGLRVKTVAGHSILCGSSRGQEMLLGEKLAHGPVPEAWQRRLGSYDLKNAEGEYGFITDVRLLMDRGYLMVENGFKDISEMKVRQVLRPLDGREAVTAGLWRGGGETIAVVTVNGQEVLRYSGYDFARKKDD